jgi:hypothetical protein
MCFYRFILKMHRLPEVNNDGQERHNHDISRKARPAVACLPGLSPVGRCCCVRVSDSQTAICRIEHAMPLPAGGREVGPFGWRLPWPVHSLLAVCDPQRPSPRAITANQRPQVWRGGGAKYTKIYSAGNGRPEFLARWTATKLFALLQSIVLYPSRCNSGRQDVNSPDSWTLLMLW